MKKFLIAALLATGLAFGQAEVRDGKFYFNGERQELAWGRTSFKLSNIITHHFTGQGGGKYGLGYATAWVHHNQAIFGEHVVLRVFLETAGWAPCDTYNGVPENCMFGSEPRDQGFWDRERLRDGVREKDMHPVGEQVLEWFYATSQETGAAFELVIDATLKHDDIPKGEIDHVIRQVGVHMGDLQLKYPRALIIPSARNEWDAHNQSGHTLAEVNMWAVRWDRDNYTPGWYAPLIVDHGGLNYFNYDVGPEDGKFRAGMIHPERDSNWATFPTRAEMDRLRRDARGMPVGSTESMYYVEKEDLARANTWYRPAGWTTDFTKYKQHVESLEAAGFDYIIIHDEKGVQCDPAWPRVETRVETWMRTKLGGGEPPPEPEPESPFKHVLEDMYQRILLRSVDETGLELYTEWLAQCYNNSDYTAPCHSLVEDALIQSDEYKNRFGEVELPEPPPDGPAPEDYLNLTRARALDCELSNDRECSGNRLQTMTWRGGRDFQLCAAGCPNEIPGVFGISAVEMTQHGDEGMELVTEGRNKFERKLSVENRRCEEQPEFCGKSNVRKAVWKDYNDRMEAHDGVTAELYSHLVGQPGYGTHYDAVHAWCRYIKGQ